MDRRNHYRELHVQPDAPFEVIRAAYRALIALHHPDSGGHHQRAARITEAWHILGDAERRAAYDARRAARGDAIRARRAPSATSAAEPVDHSACPFCRTPVLVERARCARCQAPLARVPDHPPGDEDATEWERRRLPRVSRADWSLLYLDWRSEPVDVRLRNLSLGGASVYAGAPIAVGERVRIVGAPFDAVLDVVACRRHGVVFVVHGRFVTAHVTVRTERDGSTTS